VKVRKKTNDSSFTKLTKLESLNNAKIRIISLQLERPNVKFNYSGNIKLGKNVSVISRPVGVGKTGTCPSGCPFLERGCYAKIIEGRMPNTRKFAENNVITSLEEIFLFLAESKKIRNDVRIHERGDFLLDGKLDIEYLNNWKKALTRFNKNKSGYIPKIWVYTHVYHRKVADLQKYGVIVYASVHTEDDIKQAKKAGFKLFAIDSKIQKKRRVKGIQSVSSYIDLPALGRTLVCPEQRMGDTKNITCSTCNYCTTGKGNIAFLKH